MPQGPLPSWALQPPVDANFNTGGSVNKQETAIPQQIRVQNSQVAAPLENIENFNRPPLIPPTQQQQQQFNFNFQPQPGVDNTANPFILSPNVPQEGFIQRNLQPQERLPNENSNIPSFERTIVRNNLGQNQPTQFNFQPLRTPNFNGGFHGAPSFEHNANPTVSTTKVPQNITKSALNTSDLTVKVQTSTELSMNCGIIF